MTAKQLSGRPNLAAFGAFLSTAHELADLSGEAILPHFRRSLTIENKAQGSGFDPVTAADRAAEDAIRRALEDVWPEHGITGEEFGNVRPGAPYAWVIDPIDGTRSFILGTPMWGTLIGLQEGSLPILGLMDQPFTKERFWSGPENSFMRVGASDSVILSTRMCADLKEASLSTTHPDLFAEDEEATRFNDLAHRVKLTRYGGDCYAYAMLAAGFIDVIVEAGLKPYDIVALIPIIERAGGAVTTWEGEAATKGGRIVATGDKRLHEQVLKILQG